jgi:hypothetical protein
VIPVLGLAFVGLESGTLHFLAQFSRVATPALLAALILAVGFLGRRTSRASSPLPARGDTGRSDFIT